MSLTWNKAIKRFTTDFPSSHLPMMASSLLVAALTLAGFGLRLGHLLGRVYHIDEFISMLAAVMVAQKGLPILPSGLFYDHGLLVSYLSGAFIRLLGFNELVARWPLCLASTLTIPASYGIGRRLFTSRLAGLVAATLVTLDTNAIRSRWAATIPPTNGGRARRSSIRIALTCRPTCRRANIVL